MNFHSAPNRYPGEVTLRVTDLEQSRQFYEDIIGLKTLDETAGRIALTANGELPLVILEQPADVSPKEQRTSGLYHFALLLPTRADLANTLEHLLKKGIRLGAADHLVSEALYLSDPDGNGIEIYWDRPPASWEWNDGLVNMTTDPLNGEELIALNEGKEFAGMPTETLMGHIHLHVAELPAARAFYEALGFQVVSHYPNALFLSTGDYHHHIAINTWNGEGAPPASEKSAGLASYVLNVSDEETLEGIRVNLQRLDYTLGENLQVADPSGNLIQLRIDRS